MSLIIERAIEKLIEQISENNQNKTTTYTLITEGENKRAIPMNTIKSLDYRDDQINIIFRDNSMATYLKEDVYVTIAQFSAKQLNEWLNHKPLKIPQIKRNKRCI